MIRDLGRNKDFLESDDVHLPTRCASIVTNFDPHDDTEATVTFIWYNVGIQKNEVTGQTWKTKCAILSADIKRAFTCAENLARETNCVQAMSLSEFGNMFESIDTYIAQRQSNESRNMWVAIHNPSSIRNTKDFFEQLLVGCDLTHSTVYSTPPYVAIVDENYGHVDACHMLSKLCSKEDMFVQRLVLRHVECGRRTRVFNAHIPTSSGTAPRKKAIIAKMCALATGGGSSGVEARAMTDAWIIGGDLNVDVATMGQQCNDYVEAHVPCVSLSGWPCDKDAQKADFALSTGD